MGFKLFGKRGAANEQGKGAKLITLAEPQHVISEQFRHLRSHIEYADALLPKLQVVMVTSAEMSDGKTTCAANLTVSWASTGKRVLYVDTDLRRPTAHHTFNLLNMRGVSHILASGLQPQDCLQQTDIPNLSVLTAGVVPPNPAEFLGTPRMAALIAWMRGQYDVVILDVPPVVPVTDAQVLTRLVDGVVLVVALGKTNKVNLKRTVDTLALCDVKLLGVVTRHPEGRKNDDATFGYTTIT